MAMEASGQNALNARLHVALALLHPANARAATEGQEKPGSSILNAMMTAHRVQRKTLKIKFARAVSMAAKSVPVRIRHSVFCVNRRFWSWMETAWRAALVDIVSLMMARAVLMDWLISQSFTSPISLLHVSFASLLLSDIANKETHLYSQILC